MSILLVKAASVWRTYRDTLTALVVALGLAVAAFGAFKVHTHLKAVEATREALRVANEQIAVFEADQALRNRVVKVERTVAKAHTRAVTEIKEKENAKMGQTIKALADNPEWASVLVPNDVLVSLRDD